MIQNPLKGHIYIQKWSTISLKSNGENHHFPENKQEMFPVGGSTKQIISGYIITYHFMISRWYPHVQWSNFHFRRVKTQMLYGHSSRIGDPNIVEISWHINPCNGLMNWWEMNQCFDYIFQAQPCRNAAALGGQEWPLRQSPCWSWPRQRPEKGSSIPSGTIRHRKNFYSLWQFSTNAPENGWKI